MRLILSSSKLIIAICALSLLIGCGDSGGGVTPPPPAPPPPPPSSVTISGAITYDSVPHNTSTSGLNYNATTQRPVRGALVEAVDGGGTVLDNDTTDNSGAYSVDVDANTNVRIRVRSRIQQNGSPSWNIAVRNNTSSNALYAIQGALASSGAANSTRNLNAASGWGTTSYTGTRAAAPFAILDAIYDAILAIENIDPGTNFPLLQVYWSVNNRPADGDIDQGEIGTTSYTRVNNTPTILVLGTADNDTDEYDGHVIVHEFGHYIEDQLSRSDSVGGAHSLGNRLDPRVAFSEGYGNAFSGIIRNDQFYRDSFGPQQADGFSINVEANNIGAQGWYSESSAQSILFDIADSASDGADAISAGYGPIHAVLTSNSYIQGPAPLTIFSFVEELRNSGLVNNTQLNSLVSAQGITGTGLYGDGETDGAGIMGSLPPVKTVTLGGGPINICSVDDAGTYNKLGNRQLIRLNIPTSQAVTLSMTTTMGSGRDPDFFIFQAGNFIDVGGSANVDSEVLNLNLTAGDYWIDANDYFNIDPDEGPTGDVCFDFTAN